MFKISLTESQFKQVKQSGTEELDANQYFLNPTTLAFQQADTGFIVVEPDRKILFFNKEALSILAKGNEPLSGVHFLKMLSKTVHQALAMQSSATPAFQSVVFKSGRRYYSVWTIPLFKQNTNGSSGIERNVDGLAGILSAKRSLIIMERLAMEEPNLPLLNRKFGFTPRESHIVRLLFRGRSDKLIGQALGISTETVREHMRNIRSKLGAASRLEVVSFLLDG